MRQKARVIESHGRTATVAVSRRTMCEGCEKNGSCGSHCDLTGIIARDPSMKTEARNPIGAEAGDLVEVETDSSRVLGYAALVFLVPIAVCALFYFLAVRWIGPGLPGVIGAAVGFLLTFAGIAVYDRSLRKRSPEIVIVARVSEG